MQAASTTAVVLGRIALAAISSADADVEDLAGTGEFALCGFDQIVPVR